MLTREELRARRSQYPGFTRPELAVVTALTKIDLARTLAPTPLIDDPHLIERFLRPYFPVSIAEAVTADLPAHGLRRELIATRIVNELVDLMGSVFIFNQTRDFDIQSESAARAWLVAADVIGLRERADELRCAVAEGLEASAEVGAFLALEQSARRACVWAVSLADPPQELGATVAYFKPAFAQLLPHFDATLTSAELDRFERTYRDLRAAVQQESLALELARLAFAGHLLNVLSLSFALGAEPLELARVYFGMSERFAFATLESALDALNTEDRWERYAARDLRAELTWARNQLCRAQFSARGNGASLVADASAGRRTQQQGEVDRLMNDLRALPTIGLPPLQVAVRALARLANRA
jgi:glutamate dehydrogenase